MDNETVLEMGCFVDFRLCLDNAPAVCATTLYFEFFLHFLLDLSVCPGTGMMQVCISEKTVEEGSLGTDDFEFFMCVSLFLQVVKNGE